MKNNKPTPFLDFYNECCKNGDLMKCDGLCNSNPVYVTGDIFYLFIPSIKEMAILIKNNYDWAYWASNSEDNKMFEFTDLRKNIVLLCAAINDEL